jgi:autoinducer 2-degrading protein
VHVVVGFHKIKTERLDTYLENIKLHSRNSAGEPGCVRYEVLQDTEDPTVFCLIEAFQDEPAFLAHRASDHYKWWMELSADWRDQSPLHRNVMDFIAQDS